MSRNKVEMIQEELKKVVGPIGAFIVEKQIKDMKESKDNFPEDKIPVLIERSVESGVFDPSQRKTVMMRMKKNIEVEGSD